MTGNSAASVFNLISFAIIANQLGPTYLGIFVLCQTYALIVNDLFNIQTWESMVKYGAAKLGSDTLKGIISTNLILDLISALLAVTLAVLIAIPAANLMDWNAALPENESMAKYLSLYSLTIIFNLTTFTIGIPRLFRQFLSVSIIYVVMAILKLAVILTAALTNNNLQTYLIIYIGFEIATNVALIILSMGLVNKHCGSQWWKRKFSVEREQLIFIWWTNLRTIVRIPVQRMDVIIISAIMDMNTLGVYKVYKELAGFIGRVGEPVNQAIFPEFAKLIGQNNSSESIRITKQTMKLLLLVGIGVLLVLSVSSGLILEVFFGSQYLPLISALYLLMALYTASFVTIPINSLFIAAGFAKYSFLVLLFTNIIYLTSAYALGLHYGIFGLISAYAIQLILNKGLKIYLMNKHPDDWSNKIR